MTANPIVYVTLYLVWKVGHFMFENVHIYACDNEAVEQRMMHVDTD